MQSLTKNNSHKRFGRKIRFCVVENHVIYDLDQHIVKFSLKIQVLIIYYLGREKEL